jgi:hypothetical protein
MEEHEASTGPPSPLLSFNVTLLMWRMEASNDHRHDNSSAEKPTLARAAAKAGREASPSLA